MFFFKEIIIHNLFFITKNININKRIFPKINMRKIFLFFGFLVSFSICTQYVPIQNTYDGLTLGNNNATLHIEVFYDLICPASEETNE